MRSLTVFLLALLSSHAALSASGAEALLHKPPMTTATSWVMSDVQTNEILFGQRANDQQQMASLTKIMTAIVALDYLTLYPTELESVVVVSKSAAMIAGTSALLEQGDRLSVEDLLYGMLLPSGNDAAVSLSEFVAKRLAKIEGLSTSAIFVGEMNKQAEALGLENTRFFDVHGMGKNYSTARDLAILSGRAHSYELFRKVVGTQEHRVTIRSNQGGHRALRWTNTNELLGDFTGVKTGHTNGAGGCLILAGYFRDREYVLVVLGSSNKRTRFLDGYNLFQWGLHQIASGSSWPNLD